MKKSVLALSLMMAIQTVAPSWSLANETDAAARQEQLLKLLEEKGAKQAIRSLSDEELLSVKSDLRLIVSSLQEDLRLAEKMDDGRIGVKIRTAGLIGIGVAASVFVLGVLSDSFGAYKNLSPAAGGGGGTMAGFVFGALIGSAAIVTVVAGQAIVILSPSEAAKVEDRIDKLDRALILIEKRLK